MMHSQTGAYPNTCLGVIKDKRRFYPALGFLLYTPLVWMFTALALFIANGLVLGEPVSARSIAPYLRQPGNLLVTVLFLAVSAYLYYRVSSQMKKPYSSPLAKHLMSVMKLETPEALDRLFFEIDHDIKANGIPAGEGYIGSEWLLADFPLPLSAIKGVFIVRAGNAFGKNTRYSIAIVETGGNILRIEPRDKAPFISFSPFPSSYQRLYDCLCERLAGVAHKKNISEEKLLQFRDSLLYENQGDS